MNFETQKNEVDKTQLENFKRIKSETKITFKEAKDYCKNLLDEFKSAHEKFEYGGKFVDYVERLNHTPTEDTLGHYEGERGESKFIPSAMNNHGKSCLEALKEKGLDGIEYKKAEPNFSKCAEATVSIEHMTEHREDSGSIIGNFTQADRKLAEKWNFQKFDGKDDWTEEKIYDYRKEHNFSWHERCDTKHMDLVDERIHKYCVHSGGVAECKARDSKNSGGIFDE